MILMSHCICSKSVACKIIKLHYSVVRKFCYKKGFANHEYVLKNLLGCTKEETTHIMDKNHVIHKLDERSFEKTIEMLKRFRIPRSQIIEKPQVLSIRPASIEHHSLILQEGGVGPISATLLVSYLQVMSKRISLLRAHHLLSQDTNVAESFLSHLEEPPPNVTPYCVLKLEDMNELSLKSVYEDVMKHYLAWRLEISREEMETLVKKYVRIRHRSLRLLRRTLNILEDDLGFSKERIVKNAYLVHSHPDNTLDTMKRIPVLAGLDIKDAFDKYPKLVMIATDTLLRSYYYIKEFGISDSSMQRCLHVFTLGSESLRQRLENLKEVPEFRPLASHPRVLRLVHYQQKALSRLDYLQEQQVRCASLHLLSGTRAYFEKYAQIGEDRTRGSDCVRYLSEHLDIPHTTVRAKLHHHHLWNHVPLVTVSGTLEFLLKKGFSKEDIWCNVHLLLYPREHVERELEMLPEREEVASAQDLASRKTGTVPTITPSFQLALCIYYLEKVHHFSGDGIWTSKGESEPLGFDVNVSIPEDANAFRTKALERQAKMSGRAC